MPSGRTEVPAVRSSRPSQMGVTGERLRLSGTEAGRRPASTSIGTRLEVESAEQPDRRHAIGGRPHLEDDATLAAHAHDEVHTALEIGSGEIEAIAAFLVLALEPLMAQPEIRADAYVGRPPCGGGGTRHDVEHVQVDAELSRHFANAEVEAGSELDVLVEERTERGVRPEFDELGVERNATQHADAKTLDGSLDRTLRLLDLGRNIRLLRGGRRRKQWRAGIGSWLLGRRDTRHHQQRQG